MVLPNHTEGKGILLTSGTTSLIKLLLDSGQAPLTLFFTNLSKLKSRKKGDNTLEDLEQRNNVSTALIRIMLDSIGIHDVS